jgi:hypothetical protein
MLFRTNEGKIIEIKKYNFTNDKLYYQKIMEIKKPNNKLSFAKLEKTFNDKND